MGAADISPPPSPQPTPRSAKSPHLQVPPRSPHLPTSPTQTPAPVAHAFPSTEARLLAAMAPHLWASPTALAELVMHNSNNVLDFSHYQRDIQGPLPQCMRLTNGRIYMRKVFDVLGALIIESKFAVIAGSAGVGKSMFLWLDFAQRITRSEPCAWVLHDAVVLIRSAKAEIIPLATLTDDDTPGLDEVMLFVLALLEFCKGIIMATGPYEECWHDLKQRWMPTLGVYVMPPWSFHEIHDGATTLMNFNSPALVNRLMDRFGTVPHDIFTILALGPTHGDAMWTAHEKSMKRFPEGIRGLRRFADTSGPTSFTVLPKYIHPIFLSCPCDPSDLTWESSRCLLRSSELNKTISERAADEFTAAQNGAAAIPPSRANQPPQPQMTAHHYRESPQSSTAGIPLQLPPTHHAQYQHHAQSPNHHKISASRRSTESLPLFP
ncbi:hypothetical protein BKA62DRAFT_719666 [Auriculariales sp. MPI-PUGE-AT-0066]|nr:hypothetical protein BKA62DRAFT_719666 [Auriculariales sp. MPI-PUGE-AT-0066]